MGRLIILMLWGVLVYLLWKTFFSPRPARRDRSPRNEQIESMVRDPQCETYVPESSALRKSIRGETHYFCSKECLQAYRKRSKS